MEMHTQQSLYEIHGFTAERRPARRFRAPVLARMFGFLTRKRRAIEGSRNEPPDVKSRLSCHLDAVSPKAHLSSVQRGQKI
jgi:hypothetical protein